MTGVPYTFATATSPIPLSQLDSNFNTTLTIGSTSVGLGNSTASLANVSLTGSTSIAGANITAALTYGGVTLSNAVTGTGNMVLSASPTLTGTLTGAAANFSSNVGIGMTPSNILDITQSQNGTSIAQLLNNSGGASAASSFRLSNGSATSQITLWGSGFSSTGLLAQNGLFIANGGAGGITFDAQSSAPIIFATNDTERGRFGTDGSFLVGGTTNVGAGYMYASGGIKIRTTGTGLVNTGELFSVNGGSSACIGLLGTVSGTEPLGIANSGADTASYIRFTNGASTTGSITRTAGVTVLNGTSDIRLKIISEHQKNRRAEIEALWIGDFEKFSNFEHSGQSFHSFGIIAQQAHETLGDLSTISPPENENDIWLAPSEPYAYLALWGVKDLYAENEALKARITALESK